MKPLTSQKWVFVRQWLADRTRTIVQGTAEDDDHVMSLVESVLTRPPAERESYLRAACAGDNQLFDEVWKYVEWEDRMNGFLLRPLFAPVSNELAFETGEILDNRFRIVREVAQGGMGIVYEAMDEKLGRRIAIKCAKPGFGGQLPPEVRHASEIAHPGVCKIFEIHTVTGRHGTLDFLTMEFLDGETLAERLGRGPLDRTESQEIAQQLCAAVAEAHRSGVIHGDLKSNNVILTKSSEGGIRAVITDFGLARGLKANLGTFQSGSACGTPEYMAPELWKGEGATIGSDIYALGVILYELASGTRPFTSVQDLNWKDRLTRRPPPLKHPWRRIVESCLEPNVANRCADVSKIAGAITPFNYWKHWAVASAVLLGATVGAIAYTNMTVPQEMVRLAIIPFETSPADRPLTDGLLDGMAEQLRHVKPSTAHRLTVIPQFDAVRNKADTPAKAAGLLGATHTLTGTLHRDGNRTEIHASLTDVRSRLPLKEWTAKYEPEVLQDMPVALAGMVIGTLRLPPLVQVATVNAAAYPDFIRGVGLLDRNNVNEALPFLYAAARSDGNSPLVYARLAEAQHLKYQFLKDEKSSAGDEWLQQANASLLQAELRNPDLAAVRAVSGMINKYAGAYEKALDDYQRALQIEPLNGDVWRRLGDVYQEVNQFRQAVAAYEKAIDVQPGYFKNHQALCYLHADQGNYDEAIRQCQIMVSLVPQLSEAHYALSKPYLAAGRYSEGELELRSAVNLDARSSRSFHALALALVYQKRYAEAVSYFRNALAIGPENEVLYLNLGTAYRLSNLRKDADDAYRKAMTIAEAELGRNPRDRTLRSHLAYLCAQLGERSRAESEAAQALHLAPGSFEVTRMVVQTYEALGERNRALALAASLPDDMLRRLNRSPDLADFRTDYRFQQLLKSHLIQ